jgi:hypothetical protein
MDKGNSTELDNKLATMMAERDNQDKIIQNSVLTEKEYEEKYGKQPGGNTTK